MTDNTKSPGEVFDSIWENVDRRGTVPPPQKSWLETVFREMAPVSEKRILEAGCGTGLISLEIANAGAECTLLDISPAALKIARRIFEEAGRKAEFEIGDLFELPFPDESFDIVWNSGVLEHFEPDMAKAGLKEMCRVCKKNGMVIVLVPSARALIYRLGKYVMEKRNTWIYGREIPVWSMKKMSSGGWECMREYVIDFASQISFWPFPGRTIIKKLLNGLEKFPIVVSLLTTLLGGYMLVSVFKHRD